jgi:hypothetical protein
LSLHVNVEVLAADAPLEFIGSAFGDRLAMVNHDDAVGKLVCFFEVLRGEQHGGAALHAVANDLPQFAAATWVEPGSGLVEEEHRRVGNKCAGQVDAPAHTAGERLQGSVSGFGKSKALDQCVGSTACLAALHAIQAADHFQVLGCREVLIDCGVLARQADAGAHALRVSKHIDAGNCGRAFGGLDQGGED